MPNYFHNHVTAELKDVSHGTIGLHIVWDCYLAGTKIGRIEFSEKPMYSRKPYEALSYYPDEYAKGGDIWCRKHMGGFDTLYEARRALLAPARELLQLDMKKRAAAPAALLPETDCQFYPTPSDVAGKLLSAVDWHFVSTVLEPSAGRGDLIDYAFKRNRKRYRGYHYDHDLEDVDCIEIDPNLRATLTGKGFRVVHDDFLTFTTRKRYDLILMNPPFSEGDQHLLKAIELCENGGQVACILNAETIRNPYTNSRKVLAKQLRRYGASIRFVKNGFSNAARRTDVEIALVNVNIPYRFNDSNIYDQLEKAHHQQLDMSESNELAPANDIERLIREYDLLCQAGISLMEKYNSIAPYIQNASPKEKYSSPIITLSVAGDSCKDRCSPHDLNNFLRTARARYWRQLFDLPQLRDRMTSTMRDEFSSTIEDMKDYEFSFFNIQQVVDRIKGQIVVGVEEAIVKCFDKLSAEHAYHKDIQNDNVHYYNGWKTNKAHCVNIKCIIPTYGCFVRGYKWKGNQCKDTLEGLNVRGCFQTLDDLEKALDYLDKGETPATSLERMLQLAAEAGKTKVECKYFTVVFYKKGTCHITFRDQKIVDRLNIAVGRQRAWLPPAYGKARYEDMDTESQRVIDEFQGREKYEAVLSRPTDYIIETKVAPLLLG